MDVQRRNQTCRPRLEMESSDFLSVLNRLDDGVIISDNKGNILFYNLAQSHIDGLKPQDVVGLNVTDIYKLNNQTSMVMQCVHRGISIKNRTFFYRTSSGKVANTITSVYPVFDGTAVRRVICFVKDYELLQKSTPMTSISDIRPDLGNGTRFTFADLIGNSPDFRRMVSAARKAASSSSPIMIQGETGTGKELFAQSIHNHGWRNKKKFVGVNCSAIPHDLLEGLLFGTTKGAFTGALDKPGLFEIADGGTLFLDELLAMPLSLQAKLLRVIQEKVVRRVGSPTETGVDVKIISSVSDDPRTAVNNKKLRMDLFYRLGVVMIKLPPLRHRRDGMPELVFHFIEKINGLLGTHVKKVSDDVMELFNAYQWPGNIRELEHLIEGAMNMAGYEEVLSVDHFSSGMWGWQDSDTPGDEKDILPENDWASCAFSLPECASPIDSRESQAPVAPAGGTVGDALPASGAGPHAATGEPHVKISLARNQAEHEKQAIRDALSATRGNVTKAATMLELSRQLLHYKMKKHGLSRLDFMRR